MSNTRQPVLQNLRHDDEPDVPQRIHHDRQSRHEQVNRRGKAAFQHGAPDLLNHSRPSEVKLLDAVLVHISVHCAEDSDKKIQEQDGHGDKVDHEQANAGIFSPRRASAGVIRLPQDLAAREKKWKGVDNFRMGQDIYVCGKTFPRTFLSPAM